MNYAPDSSWILDPREPFSEVFDNKADLPMGTGNQVSVEFNFIYRWHANVSAKDEKWTQNFFRDLFPGQEFTQLPLQDLLTGMGKWRDNIRAQNPECRTFGGLKRDRSGAFDTKALAKLIAESTQDVSGKYFPFLGPPPPCSSSLSYTNGSRLRGAPSARGAQACCHARHEPSA